MPSARTIAAIAEEYCSQKPRLPRRKFSRASGELNPGMAESSSYRKPLLRSRNSSWIAATLS